MNRGTVSQRKKITGNGHKPLNARQRKFIAAKAKGISSEKAALEAGYSPSTAVQADRDLMRQPSVRAAFQALLRKAIPDSKIIRRLQAGLDAKATKFFAHEGKVVSKRNVIDYNERRRYAELTGRFGGLLDPERSDALAAAPIQLVLMHVPPWAPKILLSKTEQSQTHRSTDELGPD